MRGIKMLISAGTHKTCQKGKARQRPSWPHRRTFLFYLTAKTPNDSLFQVGDDSVLGNSAGQPALLQHKSLLLIRSSFRVFVLTKNWMQLRKQACCDAVLENASWAESPSAGVFVFHQWNVQDSQRPDGQKQKTLLSGNIAPSGDLHGQINCTIVAVNGSNWGAFQQTIQSVAGYVGTS